VEAALREGKINGSTLMRFLGSRTDVPPAPARVAVSEREFAGWVESSRNLALAALDATDHSQPGESLLNPWSALEHGTLSPVEVLTRCRPFASAASAVGSVPLDPHERESVDAAIDELIARHLTGNVHAWLAVAALAADFAGSLPELLRTAAAAVG
jgi:hypothetical protein